MPPQRHSGADGADDDAGSRRRFSTISRAGLVPGSVVLGIFIVTLFGLMGGSSAHWPALVGSHAVALAAAPTPSTPKAADPLPFYRVQSGDNLTRIAHRYGVRVQDLVAWNQLSNPDVLQVGQILAVTPPPTRQLAARGELPVHAAPDEVEMLARLVEAEAGDEPFWGRVAVAAVVVNRTRHPGFPATITGVIHQPGQFPPVSSAGFTRLTPDEVSRAAAITALEGVDPTGGALFFYNPKVVGPHDWWQDRRVQAVIGGHTFTL